MYFDADSKEVLPMQDIAEAINLIDGKDVAVGQSEPKPKHIEGDPNAPWPEDNICDETIPKNLKHSFFQGKFPPDLLEEYDAVGFSLDNCLAKYNAKEYAKLVISSFLEELYVNCVGYPKSTTNFDFDKHLGLFTNCVVWDIKTGAVLKLSEGKQITHAMLGFQKLSEEQLTEMYGSPPIFDGLKFPDQNNQLMPEDKAHWTFTGFFDSCKVAVICQVVDMINKLEVTKTFNQFAFDLNEV